MDTEEDTLHGHAVQVTLPGVCSLVPAYADFLWPNVLPACVVFLEPQGLPQSWQANICIFPFTVPLPCSDMKAGNRLAI